MITQLLPLSSTNLLHNLKQILSHLFLNKLSLQLETTTLTYKMSVCPLFLLRTAGLSSCRIPIGTLVFVTVADPHWPEHEQQKVGRVHRNLEHANAISRGTRECEWPIFNRSVD